MTTMTRFTRVAILSVLAASAPFTATFAHGFGQMARTAETPSLVVFFEDWSGALDHAARDVIKQAADRARQTPGARVLVAGYADSTGTKEADLALTQLRARRVADLLEEDGVPKAEITMQAEGAQRIHGVASRRVEITISGR
jgi:outer membrane protein OmpA-like peptidoglycan-associated protein